MYNFGLASLILLFVLSSAIGYSDESSDAKQRDNQKDPSESIRRVSVPEWIQALHDQDDKIRAEACHALEAFGPEARPALPALIDALGDREPYVRWSAAYAIGAIGPEAVTAVPNLITSLRDPDEFVRVSAALSIGKIGPEAKSAVPSLIERLKDQESDVRAWAAIALGDIGREPAIVVPALATALKNEKVPCRYFGSMAFYASRDVKRYIAESLGRFGQAAVPVLTGLLAHPNKEVRWCALYSLGEIGADANAAADAVSKKLQDDDEWVGALAVRTFVIIEPDPERVIPLLIDSLQSKSDMVRFVAAESLGEFGPKARAAIPMLVKVYHARDIEIGGSLWGISQAIKRIDPDAARELGIK